jgi:hypothetical protein
MVSGAHGSSSDSDDADNNGSDGSTSKLAFQFVDYHPAPAASTTGASRTSSSKGGQSKKRKGGKRRMRRRVAPRWCSKDFDVARGVYTCSTDGHYMVKLVPTPPPPAAPCLFVTLVHKVSEHVCELCGLAGLPNGCALSATAASTVDSL